MTIKIKQQRVADDQLWLGIQVPAADLTQFVTQAYLVLAYREGLIAPDDPDQNPRRLLEMKLTAPIANEMATEAVMSMTAPFARTAVRDVTTVGSPNFPQHDNLTPGKDFSYTAVWAVLPDVELSSYDAVEITLPRLDVSTETVQDEIDAMLDRYADYRPIGGEGPVKAGDIVDLSLTTSKDGQNMGGLTFENRPYITSSGTMPDEFDAQIVGMGVGQMKEFTFEAPARLDASDNPIMEPFDCRATVHGFLERIVPQLTDEWVAANMEGCDTVEGYRSHVREQLLADEREQQRHYRNYVAASELAKRFTGRIPDAAYEAMQADINYNEQMEARNQGVTVEQLRQMKGVNDQQQGIRNVLQTRERLVQSMALDALARHLKIKVDDRDIDEFFKVSAPAGQAANMRRQFEGSSQMYLAREGARRLKANDFLSEHAIIHYEDGGNADEDGDTSRDDGK